MVARLQEYGWTQELMRMVARLQEYGWTGAHAYGRAAAGVRLDAGYHATQGT